MTDVAAAQTLLKQALELLTQANQALNTEPAKPNIAKFKNAEDLKQTFPPDLQKHLTVTEATEHWNLKTEFVSTEKWERMNEIVSVSQLGGKWIKDGKASRWEIPK